MLDIELSRETIEKVTQIAEWRNKIKQENGVKTKLYGENDLTAHKLGVMAEFAVAEWLGVPVNDEITLSGDGGVDFVSNGKTIDVKMRGERQRDLMAYTDMADFTADYAILCWPHAAKSNAVTIVGYISRDDFKKAAYLSQMADRSRLVLAWQCLKPITRMKNGA